MTKYGLFVYNGTDNLGDEIQSLAARQFLPQVDYFIDRDLLTVADEDSEEIKVIMNGWYIHSRNGAIAQPNPRIKGLVTSMHITPSVKPVMLQGVWREYLTQYGPVGCRDFYTLGAVRKAGLNAFFSGCMTLTLNRPEVERDHDLVLINDTPEKIAQSISAKTKKKTKYLCHSGYAETNIDLRFKKAEELLRLYASASCVVTSRLHCALPCLAIGTPVLLVNTALDSERFAGLSSFVWSCTNDQFLNENRFFYDVNDPLPNPVAHLPFREQLTERAKAFISAP